MNRRFVVKDRVGRKRDGKRAFGRGRAPSSVCPPFTRSSSLKTLKRVIEQTTSTHRAGTSPRPADATIEREAEVLPHGSVLQRPPPLQHLRPVFSTTDPGGQVCGRVAGWSRDSQPMKQSRRVALQQCSQLRHRGVTSCDPGNSFHAARRKTRTSQKLINKLNNLEFGTRLKLILFSLFLFIYLTVHLKMKDSQ